MTTNICVNRFLTNKIKTIFNKYNNQLNNNNRYCRKLIKFRLYSTNDNSKDDLKEYNTPIEKIRNFGIIAHIDHGKSTLADRLMEMTGAIRPSTSTGAHQVLDNLQVEKDRGITVKAQTVSLKYIYKNEEYNLNIIDTPGHVDFSNEVERSLAALNGVILLVDANDGIQAQTVANFYLAFSKDLAVIPVINKIDLKNANPNKVAKQLKTLFDIEENDIIKISAKIGTNVDKLLEAVVERIPCPNVDRNKPFRALIFDSWFDRYRGAIMRIFVSEGTLSVKQSITSIYTGKSYEIRELLMHRPEEEKIKTLFAGQVGCIACNIRSSSEAHIGDTLHVKNIPVEPLIGFEPSKPMVFAGIYPTDQSQHIDLRNALEKLVLNDSGVTLAVETSPALGHGWRLGFLGLLHMEVFCQRLEQEYGAAPIITAPSVTYKAQIIGKENIKQHKTNELIFNNPVNYPNPQIVEKFYEPIVLGTVILPVQYLGPVMSLCLDKRGIEESTKYIDNDRIMLQFIFPLNEIIIDFHDTLKSITSGYASFDYEDNGYVETEIVKLNILLNGLCVEELSTIVHYSRATEVAKHMANKLVNIIPRQQFQIAIQITVGSKILARETLKPFRKDITGKLKSGGDIQRRRKLLQQQAEGKKKLRMIGNISLPRDTFIDILKR